VKDLVDSAPQLDLATGLYGEKDAGDHPMNEYKLQLSATKEISWEKHTPVITFWYAFLSQIFVYLSHLVFEGPVKRPEKDRDRTEFNRKKTGNLMDRSRP
jgi:hypothetical protein